MNILYSILILLAVCLCKGHCNIHHQIVSVHEVDFGQYEKRTIELLPNNIDIDLRSKEENIHLKLTRMKQIDHNKVKTTFDDPTFVDQGELFDGEVGYYQDKKNLAAISIEVKVDGIHITRTLTGSLMHNGKMYELHPAKEDMKHIRRVFDENGLYHDPTLHNFHVLKEVDDKLHRNVDKAARERPDRNSVRDKKEEEEEEEEEEEDDDDDDAILLSKLTELVKSLKDGPENIDIRASSPKRYDVQLMFVINYDIWKAFSDKYGNMALQRLKHYYHQILNGMHLAYSRIDDEELEIVLWLSRLHIITNAANSFLDSSNKMVTESQKSGRNTYDADKVWAKMTALADQLEIDTTTGQDVDTMMFWTREDLNSDGDILGIAYMCAVCSPYSQSQCEDNGYIAWHTCAHELAHSLGSRHDDEKRCGQKNSPKYIMHFEDYVIKAKHVTEAYIFSKCSQSDMKKCLTGTGPAAYRKQGARNCLLNKECKHGKPLEGIDTLLGSIITLDRQCQLYYADKNAKFCGTVKESICRQLPCQSVRTDNQCKTFIARAAPGTPCSSTDPSKVCYLGICRVNSTIPDSSIDNDSCDKITTVDNTVTYPTPTIQLGNTGTPAPSWRYSTTYSPLTMLRKLRRKLRQNLAELVKEQRKQRTRGKN